MQKLVALLKRLFMAANQKAREALRQKNATQANCGSANPTSEQKSVNASVPGAQAPNGKSVSEEAIRLRAYQKWEAAGKPGGDSIKFWLEAENEVVDGGQSPKAPGNQGPSGVTAPTPAVAIGAPQQAAQESPNGDQSPWWTDARKVLVTQLVVLILLPVSVVVTVYVTEASKSPNPRIEYTSSSPLYPVVEPDRSFANRINSNTDLSWRFRQELRNASHGTPSPIAAVSWLDGRAWDSEYADTYRHVTNQMIGTIKLAIKHPASAQLAKLLPQPDPKEFPPMLEIVEAFAKELSDLESKSKNLARSGTVRIRVGILNAGASDGTVFDEAVLTFGGKKIHVHMSKYVPVKSHGFEEVTFDSPGFEDGKPTGVWNPGEEEAVQSFVTLIKKGEELPFEIAITLSDKTASAKSAVPKEE